MLLTEKETRKLCQQVIHRLKADDALVTVRSSVETNQRFAANSFSTNGHTESTSVDITAWVNGRKGSAGTSELSEGSLVAAVREAERIARLSPKDQEYVPTLDPQTYRPVKAFYESTANPSPRDRARSIDRVIKMCEEKGVIGAGLHRTVAMAGGTLSQRGNFDYERRSTGSLSLTARTPDGTSSGYYVRSAGDLKQLDTDHIAQESIRRAVEGRKPQTIEPGVYPVILEAQAVHDILSYFPNAFSARPADEGRSAMSATGGKSRLGEKVFDERVNVYSDPWNEELPGSQSAPDGIPAQKIYLVRNGVVENLVYSRYWAKEKGKEPTPGPVNYIIESSSTPSPLAQMISGSERALLVSRLWYIRMVNPRSLLVTGLTRDGVWLIENGKIKHPVRNFRFNQSLMEMLAPGNVEAMGKSERVGGASGFGNASLYPALKLKKFHFTSASEAV